MNTETQRPAELAAAHGSARSGLEILESLRREGWREDIMGIVMVSGDKTLVQVVWPDGRRVEAPNYIAHKMRSMEIVLRSAVECIQANKRHLESMGRKATVGTGHVLDEIENVLHPPNDARPKAPEIT